MGARSAVVGGAVVLLLAALFVGPAVGGAAAATASCEADDARQLCVTDASLGADSLAAGESTTFGLTVENTGEERATAVVLLNVAGPDDETDSYELQRESLSPGETVTVTQSVDANTPGTHALRGLVFDDGLSHRYDATEPMTVSVAERGLGGDVDASEYALAAQQFMTAAWSEGVATCPMEGFDADALVETFDIDDGYEPVMLVTVGYPAEDAAEAERKYRRPVDEVVHYGTFEPVTGAEVGETAEESTTAADD